MTTATARLGAFARRELSVDAGRVRHFARTEVGLLLAAATVLIFEPPNGYWTPAFVLLVSSPAVGNSERDAIQRVLAALVGGAAAVGAIIISYDLPWLYVPLQAAGIGLSLYLARTTPLGPAALTGGTTFGVITGGARIAGPAGLITLACYRVLQATIGSGLGALVQLTLWRDDPLVRLRRSVESALAQVQARLDGGPVPLDVSGVTRHFELLGNAEIAHPRLAHCRADIELLLLDCARLVDEVYDHQRLPPDERQFTAARLRVAVEHVGRRCTDATFTPPPPPPPPPVLEVLGESQRLGRRVALKTALSALITLIILDAMQLTPAGGLLACLVVSQQMSTGTDLSKITILLTTLLAALGFFLVVELFAAPNVDDFGSYLIVIALALAPTLWMFIAAPRVRIAGQLGSVLMLVGLLGSERPSAELEPAALFFVSLSVGCLVVAAVDRAVWPTSRRHMMARRLVYLMRAAAQLMGDLDPRLVLAPGRDPRWILQRHLRGLVDLRAEETPPPGSPRFEFEAGALIRAAGAMQLVVARIAQARRELAGETARAASAEARAAWQAELLRQANEVDRLSHTL